MREAMEVKQDVVAFLMQMQTLHADRGLEVSLEHAMAHDGWKIGLKMPDTEPYFFLMYRPMQRGDYTEYEKARNEIELYVAGLLSEAAGLLNGGLEDV